MKLKNGSIFFAGFLAAAVLFAFTRPVDIYSAIGLAVVVGATVLAIGLFAIAALFGLYIFFLAGVDGLDAAVEALRDTGFFKSIKAAGK